ncbi:MAG: HAD family phosphatase [Puia sp.]|nr:HAD family phosphatase [Puia sp.]
MQNIKNIIFDLGGVILNLDTQRTEAAFVSLGVTGFRDLFGLGHAASFFKEYEIGTIDDRQFVDSLKKLAGLSVSDETVIEAWNAMLLDFPPERIALLDELRKHYRVFLFSNTNALHLSALQQTYRDSFGGRSLDDHFEKAYYSHLLGMRKPGVESYRHILLENGLEGAETLFVDDALVNVEGANAAGLQGFHLLPGTTILDIPWKVSSE